MDYIEAMATKTTRSRTASRPQPRGEDVRQKLLDAAIAVFGRYGFDGASTRMLAKAADVNLQAIPYYFGGKEGLYLAAADHITERIRVFAGPVGVKIRARLAAQQAGEALSPDEARALLIELLETMAHLMTNEESAAWARFIVAEQMEPTEAFERIYRNMMSRLMEAGRGLLGVILDEDPESEAVRLRAVALMGQILVFRVARAAVTRQLGWQEIGPREFSGIRELIRRAVDALSPAERRVEAS